MLETALHMIVEGLLTELPASLITAALVAACAWVIRRKRKSVD